MKLVSSEPDQIFWLILFFSLITFFIIFHKHYNFRILKILIALRLLVITILILLYFDPRITFAQSSNRDLNWNLYLDKSLSMSYHANPSVSSLQSGIDDIIARIEQKDIQLNIIDYGSKLDTAWLRGEKEFIDISTNFGNARPSIFFLFASLTLS